MLILFNMLIYYHVILYCDDISLRSLLRSNTREYNNRTNRSKYSNLY